MRRKERLARAREQQEITREKVRERKLEKEIREGIVKLPKKKQQSLKAEEERKRNLEISEMKRNLWKLRNKEKLIKDKRKSEKIERLEKIQEMEKKLGEINKILEDI